MKAFFHVVISLGSSQVLYTFIDQGRHLNITIIYNKGAIFQLQITDIKCI